MAIREDFVRARSDREMAARQEEILETAEVLLLESSDHRFTIADLASRLGISKSTVFLHFRNREELLARLYMRVGEGFFADFRKKLRKGMSDQAFCEAFVDTALASPALMILRSMMLNTVSHSLSQDYVAPAFEAIFRTRMQAVVDTEEALGLEPGKGRILIKAFMNLMCGAAQVNVMQYINTEDFPDNVAEGIRAADIRSSFLSGAELVMKGART